MNAPRTVPVDVATVDVVTSVASVASAASLPVGAGMAEAVVASLVAAVDVAVGATFPPDESEAVASTLSADWPIEI